MGQPCPNAKGQAGPGCRGTIPLCNLLPQRSTKEGSQEVKKKQQQEKTNGEIATGIVTATRFYSAEEYHQQYFQKHGLGVCHI